MCFDLSQLTRRLLFLLSAFFVCLLDYQLKPHLLVDVTLTG
ncbi:stringent starvation protein B, partial [Escherichia coli]|nr:stringent starvation protein B [Escherichia coli]MCL7333218.1 stringent starvation protein B [Escherichia coli]